ncbi:hypothetical protein FNB79_17040 [Formosa sediminum]|uniref:Uncharacterized protein n=1 Tax=Formosa sediminum TaxID=2594004 RepID=A0A516GVP9_9FLAO|nr:hypothetical protein [Formosa sediminum]QDO95603.1 hypothetical protein FNB79_17040 [Formosa sediminum]
MILKGFKEKSNKKYFNKLLVNRKISSASKRIESLGVILNIDEISSIEAIEPISKLLNIKPNSFKIIAFTAAAEAKIDAGYPIYTANDIGWGGSIKNPELELFLETKFDALISYYFVDNLDLKLLTAATKADFKIGVLQEEPRLNDLILNINQGAIEVFKSELLKYLSILKRI